MATENPSSSLIQCSGCREPFAVEEGCTDKFRCCPECGELCVIAPQEAAQATVSLPPITVTCSLCREKFPVEVAYANCKRPCPKCGEKCLVAPGETIVQLVANPIELPDEVQREVPTLLKVSAVLVACLGFFLSATTISRMPLLAIITLCIYGGISAGLALGQRWVIKLIALGACLSLLQAIVYFGLGETGLALRAMIRLLAIQCPILVVAARSWDELV